ncbi:MAG: hypothetical protein ACRELA_23510 [Candidatus Rokuibacteriota bacterium]
MTCPSVRGRAGWCVVALCVLTVMTAACRSRDGGGAAVVAPASTSGLRLSVASPPDWRPGDRWVYEWSSGRESGTKTVEVVEVREVNGIQYYIVRLGDVDHYYTRELHWAAAIRDSTVEARMVPPHPWFAWPLEVGRRWLHRGTWEDRGATRPANDTFAVVAAETVEVPAGTFQALKVARESSVQGHDEYWYVPAVRSYARWVGRRGEVGFEERLREYRPAPRVVPGSPASHP